MLRWDRYGFRGKRDGTRYAELVFLHPVGYVGHAVHFGASGGGGAKHQLVVFLARVGPVRIPQKARRDTLH
jgi:hypothetical protein